MTIRNLIVGFFIIIYTCVNVIVIYQWTRKNGYISEYTMIWTVIHILLLMIYILNFIISNWNKTL